jgi:hypothetical protein
MGVAVFFGTFPELVALTIARLSNHAVEVSSLHLSDDSGDTRHQIGS